MTFTPEQLDEIVAGLAATGEIDTRFSYLGYRHHSVDELAAMRVAAGYAPLTTRATPDGEFVLFAGVRHAE